jgi:TolB protein
VTVPVQGSGWLVLRARGDGPREPVLDLYPFASTSPVYVTIDGAPARSAEDARFFVHWIDQVVRAAAARTDWNTAAERDSTLALLHGARAEFVRRGGE